jgi:signal transduction histidine kinase
MNYLNKYLLFSFFLSWFANTSLQSQSRVIDSLKNSIADGSGNVRTIFELCGYGSSLPSDTFMFYANKAKQITIHNNDADNALLADFYIGKCYVYEGKADSALQLSDADLQQVKDISRQYIIYHKLLGLEITCLTKLRKFDATFAESYKLLESGTKYNDISAQIFASNSIGSAYFNFSSDFINTKKWWLKAYYLMDGSPVFNDFPQVLINLSYLYYGVDSTSFGIAGNNIDSAQFFLDKAFVIGRQTQSPKTLADCSATQADIYNCRHKAGEAEKMLQKGLSLYKQIGNVASIIDGLGSLADFYEDQKNYAKAIVYQKEEAAYLNQSHSGQVTEFYRSFAGNYEKTGNYAMADSMLHIFSKIQDSLYAKAKVEDLADMEAKYELSNKEAAIAKQKLELLHKDIWITVAILFIILSLIITYILFRQSKHKQIMALAEAEEKERKRIAADLHDNIGAYASAISEAIDEIENKKLVTDKNAITHLKENATQIITSLRDTIWALNKDFVSLTEISDRVKTYVHKLEPSFPNISILIEEAIAQERNMSSVRALHVFRTVQEALHNSVKHSRCDKIVVYISSNSEKIIVSIEDNGIGFTINSVPDNGNGLRNMRMRASEADFTISFERLVPSGTKVTLMAG